MTERADDWFNPVAEFLGPAYLRNAFTTGSAQRARTRTGILRHRGVNAEESRRVLHTACA